MSKVDEGLNTSSESLDASAAYSIKKNKSEIQNSNKKQTRSSTRNFTPRPSVNLDIMVVDPPSTNIRITRRTRNTNAGKERSEIVVSEPQIAEIEHINVATIGRKRQAKYFKHSLSNMMEGIISTKEVTTEAGNIKYFDEPGTKKMSKVDEGLNTSSESSVTSDAYSAKKTKSQLLGNYGEIQNSNKKQTRSSTRNFTPRPNDNLDNGVVNLPSTSIRITRRTRNTNIQEDSPKLNETFEIEEESDGTLDSHKIEEKCEISSSEIKSSRKSRAILSTPQYCNKISLQKENEEIATANSNMKTSAIKMNEPVYENEASFTVLENKETGNKRRSSSCPHETNTKNDCKLQFLSPSSKSVTKSKGSQKKDRPTPVRNTRIPKFINKVPDFKNIHTKQFEKMESLVDNHQRKLERAKDLLTPAISKDGVIVFTAQPTIKQTPLRKPVTQNHGLRIPTKLNDRYDAHFVLREFNAPVPAQNARSNIYNKQNVKELITRKLPIHDRRENVRQESRTTIRGVRLNRRFELQMAHRKIN